MASLSSRTKRCRYANKHEAKITAALQSSAQAPADSASLDQPTPDSVPVVASDAGNSAQGQAAPVKGDELSNVDVDHGVLAQMLDRIHDDKVLRSVVSTLPVDVVDMLIGSKGATEQVLHDPSMLRKALAVPIGSAIPVRVGKFIDAVAAVGETQTGAVAVGRPAGQDVSKAAAKTDATGGANETDGRQGDTPKAGPTGTQSNGNKASTSYGASNKIITNEAYADIKAKLAAKLKNQLNSGIDPEMLALGTGAAAYHIEAGARRFADFARTMATEFDTSITKLRPYLRSWYNAARDFIEDSGEPVGGMDSPDQVRDMLKSLVERETASGVQDDVYAGDAGTRASDVQPTAQDGRAGSIRAGAVDGGPRSVGRDDERRAKEPERVGQERGGAAGGRGDRNGANDGLPNVRPGSAAQGRDDGSLRSPVASKPQSARPDAGVTGENHIIEPGALDEARPFSQKARDNIAAIKLLRTITNEARPATRAEQTTLAKYVGWGGIKNAFRNEKSDPWKPGFDKIGPEVEALLTGDEYETAIQSIQYAHYTGEVIVREMWRATERLGFKGGRVFEPGMGVGNFAGMMPAFARLSRYTGLELDHTTAAIAKLLYPKHGIRQADMTRSPLASNQFDLAIGNPPFADVTIKTDPDYAARNFLLHDYFFAKSLDAVRPGGLLMFVTSAGTMNKIDQSAREYTQRNGRGIRQGNTNKLIGIEDYSTKGTYDSTMWQMMERKQGFITKFMEGDPNVRDMEDIGEESQYAQAKALTTNDPRLAELTQLKMDYDKATRRRASFDREKASIKQKVRDAEANVQRYTDLLPLREADVAARIDTKGDLFAAKIGDTEFTERKAFGEALMAKANNLTGNGVTRRGVDMGSLGGFALKADIVERSDVHGKHLVPQFYVERAGGKATDLRETESALGLVSAAENVLRNMDADVESAQQNIAHYQKIVAEFTPKLGGKFEGQAEIDDIAQKADAIESVLEAEAKAPAVAPDGEKFSIEDGIAPIALKGDEIGPSIGDSDPEGFRALRDAAIDWYRRNLVGRTKTTADGRIVDFRTSGLKKSTSLKAPDLLRSIAAIGDIIERGTLAEVRPGNNPSIKRVLFYKAPVTLDGKTRMLAVAIRETNEGRFHYDLIATSDDDVAGGQPIKAGGARLSIASGPEAQSPPADLNIIDMGSVGKSTSDGSRTAIEMEAMARDLADRLAVLGIDDKVALKLVAQMRSSVDGKPLLGVEGTYFKSLIQVALSARDPIRTLNHEAIHAMRALDLIKTAEWRTLERSARDDLNHMAEVRQRYADQDLTENQIVEEAIAENFANWSTERAAPAGFIRDAFRRVKAFLAAVHDALTGRGYNSADKLFAAMASGRVGGRVVAPVAPVAGAERSHVDAAGPMGMSDAFMAGGTASEKYDMARAPRPKDARDPDVAFANEETEARWQDARKGAAGTPETMIAKMKANWAAIAAGFSRHYVHLPNEARFSDVAQQLRKLEAAPQASKETVVRVLKAMTEGMTAADLDLFTRKVVLDDLSWEAGQDHDLPFGFTPATVADEKAVIDAAIDARPDLADAIRQRKLVVRQVANSLVEAGVLNAAQVKNPAYYRHQVLDYARAEVAYAQGTGQKLRSPHWAKRMGSTLDINANLLEAEFEWLHKALTDNAYTQGVGKGLATGGGLALGMGVRKTAWLALRMAAMYGLVQVWNHLLFGDDEDKLPDDEKARMHLNLGHDGNGDVRTLKMQGALSDALGWFGFEDAVTAAQMIENGHGDASDVVKAIALAPVNKVASGITPVITVPLQLATGKSTWPKVTEPRSIRDKWRNLAQTFSLENEYDLALSRPSRGYGASLTQAVTTTRDPGEIAYNRVKGLAHDWEEREKGSEGASDMSSPRSRALYDYRTALRYGDTTAATAAREKMRALRVTAHDLQASIKRAHPLGGIALKDRAKFKAGLSPSETQALNDARNWYEETYLRHPS